MSTSTNGLSLKGLQLGFKQQNVPADQIIITSDSLVLAPPGISGINRHSFFKSVLSEIGDIWNIIPISLPDGIRLSSFVFNAPKAPYPFLLEFTVDWQTAHWEMIPDVLSLASPSITISIEGKQVSGVVSGIVEIEQIPILIQVTLPNGTFKAQLVKEQDKQTPAARDLFSKFHVGSNSPSTNNSSGIDLKVLTIEDLMILGSVRARHLLFHLALGDIKIGPGKMSTQLTIDYFGGKKSQVSGMIWGEYDIIPKEATEPIFSPTLSATYNGPGKSWHFEGGASSGKTHPTIAALIQVFDNNLNNVPDFLHHLKIYSLHMVYDSGTGSFEFSLDVDVTDLFGPGTDLEMKIDIKLHKTADGAYEKTFCGQIIFTLKKDLKLEFDLLFDQAPGVDTAGGTTFIAAYKNPTRNKINIGELTQKIPPNSYFPLSIDLEDAFFIYDKKEKVGEDGKSPTSETNSLFGLDIGGGINLSKLPLVGKVLPAKSSLQLGIQPRFAIGAGGPFFTEEELNRLEGMIPGGGITLPNKTIDEQTGIGININVGEHSFHFDLPVSFKSKPKRPPASIGDGTGETEAPTTPVGDSIQDTGGKSTTSPGTVGTSPPAAGSGGSGIQWLNVNKSFGPVNFNRIGVQYQDKKIWAFLDAGLSVAGLTLSLNGLGVGSPIDEIKPEFKLLGIGIEYEEGPVEIGAAFMRYHVDAKEGIPAYDEYDGLATITTPSLGLSAIGSYAKVDGHTSMFIYAVLHAPLGGPAFFFVTGLAAGFGYNRAIRVPNIANVGTFPLVNEAIGGEGSPIPQDPAGRRDHINKEITKLRESIYPQIGQYFLTAGIRFSSFEMIDSFALLIVSFGQHFEVDVLGISTLIIPTPVDGEEIMPIAEVQLAIKVSFIPSEGFLGVQAQLTGNSFILDRSCHLTGGFAFFSWFDGPHQGDFVVSLGGYHPDFDKPAWYPTVPRLGLNWQITPNISVKGGIYFALCAHALMAGGRFEAVFNKGALKASFVMGIDLLVAWKPYHYDARIYLEIKIAFTYHFFGTHHINTSLGADMHIWGPDFTGTAHIHFWHVSYSIDFGKSSSKVKPIKWSTFKTSFLPPAEKTVSIAVANGLIKTIEDTAKNKVNFINPKDFRLKMNTAIPLSALVIEKSTTESFKLAIDEINMFINKQQNTVHAYNWNGSIFVQPDASEKVITGKPGIAPMALTRDQTNSTFYFKVMKTVDGEPAVFAGEDFAITPILKKAPAGMWGEKLKAGVNDNRYIENAVTGFEIQPAKPPVPGETHQVAKKDLQFTTAHIDAAFRFENIAAFSAKSTASSAKVFIQNDLTTKSTMEKRREMLETLGFDYHNLGVDLNQALGQEFILDPQVL